MPFFNYLFQLQCISDKKPSNNPSLTQFKWLRDIQGVPVSNPSSQSFTIAASATLAVFTSASKKLIFVESDKAATLLINGTITLPISPIVVGASVLPGSLLLNSTVTALSITNPSSTDPLNVCVISAE